MKRKVAWKDKSKQFITAQNNLIMKIMIKIMMSRALKQIHLFSGSSNLPMNFVPDATH